HHLMGLPQGYLAIQVHKHPAQHVLEPAAHLSAVKLVARAEVVKHVDRVARVITAALEMDGIDVQGRPVTTQVKVLIEVEVAEASQYGSTPAIAAVEGADQVALGAPQ